ncbi:MAG: hypothetical protein B6I18_07075 [Bacteroidetes bacterium 4572_112]|nr:MAG: hypothetical protein B6I18_07075 [Bacteroidetes bacterium 4572_112]
MFIKTKLFLVLILVIFSTNINAQLTVVSGIKGEAYQQFAQDINNNIGVKLNILTSKGSIENINLLDSNNVQLAFLQYDVLFDYGLKHNDAKDRIKVLLPLYDEEVQLITLKTSSINSYDDLNNKTIGMGGKNSGSHFTANFIKHISNSTWKDVNIDVISSIKALLNNEIDAFFYVGGVPSHFLMQLPDSVTSRIKLVPIILDRNKSCYTESTIYSKTYAWQDGDIKTYSVKSVIAVNINNLDKSGDKILDSLYNDLKNNLRGIQLNNFSHSKWKSVDFTDMGNVDWPVYKEAYTMQERVLDGLGWLAAILSFFQIYFIVNKLWKRKHEQLVAESISISAMFISLFINVLFGINNIGQGGYAQLSGNLLWIFASTISLVIGVGLFVNVNKKTSFLKLLLKAFNMERKEAGDLAKSLFQPSSAEKILTILGRLAMIDNDLDELEQKYIQEFADNWHIDINWDEIHKYEDTSSDRYNKLRDSVYDYLKSSPPKDQASHLIDVISLLINADGIVSDEEAIMESELTGIIKEYLGEGADVEVYKVAIVPQTPEQDDAIQARFSDLSRVEIAGGFAYLSETFHSEKYAEEVSKQYRSFNVFSIVFNPRVVSDYDEVL